MSALSTQECVALLKRATTLDLVKLLACKAAEGMRHGDGSQSYVAEATAGFPFPTAVVRVRVTRKRVRASGQSRKGAA